MHESSSIHSRGEGSAASCGPASRYHPCSHAPRGARLIRSRHHLRRDDPARLRKPTGRAYWNANIRSVSGSRVMFVGSACEAPTILRSLDRRPDPATRPLHSLLVAGSSPPGGARPDGRNLQYRVILTRRGTANHRAGFTPAQADPRLDPRAARSTREVRSAPIRDAGPQRYGFLVCSIADDAVQRGLDPKAGPPAEYVSRNARRGIASPARGE